MNVQNGAQSHPAADERISLLPLLAETISVQALGTMAVLMVPALAPAIARDLGVLAWTRIGPPPCAPHADEAASIPAKKPTLANRFSGICPGELVPEDDKPVTE